MSLLTEHAHPEGRIEELLTLHVELFEQRFGRGAGVRRFFSPGRVNLMGAHLDYNGGPVMPMALDRGTFLALRPRQDDLLTLSSTLEQESFQARLGELPSSAVGRWFDYPLGVVVDLLTKDRAASGADILYGGNLPIGAGLSSSASICVGTAHALRALWGLADDPMVCIESALWGERQWVGVRCGIMDPYAVALSRPGHVMWLDCSDASYEHLPFDTSDVLIAIVDSGVRRELAKGDFNRRVQECSRAFELTRAYVPGARQLCDIPTEVVEQHAQRLGPVLARRALHVTQEVQRTKAARRALLSRDHEEFGRCVSATHRSLRELYEVSVPELDCIVEAALEWPGVHGARLTGAGFGGCSVVVLRQSSRPGFAEHITRAFERRFSRRPQIFFFRSAAGPREYE